MTILLVTRPEHASKQFVEAVSERVSKDVNYVISPVIRICLADTAEPMHDPYTAVFTSANGVSSFLDLGFAAHGRAFCVGERTAAMAASAGFDAVSAQGNAESLLALILQESPSGTLIHFRGEHAQGDVAPKLRAAGFDVSEKVIYRQAAQALSKTASDAVKGNEDIVLPLFSPRSADLFFKSEKILAPIHVVAISEQVAARVDRRKITSLNVAEKPDGVSMLAATCRLLEAL